MKKVRLILNALVFCLVIVSLSVIFIIKPDDKISLSERRPLKTFDEVTDGKNHPFEEIEGYFLDQFPYRDSFRTLKAVLFTDILRKNDNNKIYVHDGTVVEIQDTLNEAQVKYATDVLNDVIDVYFDDSNIYYSVIPDKHYYASKQNGYPAMDYDKILAAVKNELDRGEYIDITGLLELSDYYNTDSHWSQDKITDVAEKLVSTMNDGEKITPENGWTVNTKKLFYGVYYGRSALNLSPDEIKYLSSDVTDSMVMTVITAEINNKGEITPKTEKYPVYVTEMFGNNDPYDLFMAGAQELIVIENPKAQNDKELVIFRDSFGSSISPLIACAYKKVTVVDLRYTTPDRIKRFAQFSDDADVLMLYSMGMLNSGATFKRFENKQAAMANENRNKQGTYLVDGYAVENKEVDVKQVEYAAGVIDNVMNKLLDEGNNVYVSVIPGKSYCVSRDEGGDTSYYDTAVSVLKQKLGADSFVDISQTLELRDYYKTDSHWDQVKITDTANVLLSAMNPDISPINEEVFTISGLRGFKGVYASDESLGLEGENLRCFTGDYIDGISAEYLSDKLAFEPFAVYSKDRFSNAEQYDFFLGGAKTVVTLENPTAVTDKELVVFRDSFGSSIAPLLSYGYKKVTLVDLRYMYPDMVSQYAELENSDVLFLYSDDILNNGRILKDFLRK